MPRATPSAGLKIPRVPSFNESDENVAKKVLFPAAFVTAPACACAAATPSRKAHRLYFSTQPDVACLRGTSSPSWRCRCLMPLSAPPSRP